MLSRLNDLCNEGRTLFRGYPEFVTRNLDRLAPGDIPVFVFHTIEADRFEAQLRLLRESGFRAISADEYLQIIRGDRSPQGNEVLLTIDDARSSVWRYGFPLLKRYQSHAVLFVIPGWTPDGQPEGGPSLDDVWAGTCTEPALARLDPSDQAVCTWPELKAMHDSGLVDIHSHTYFHRRVFADTKVFDVIGPGCVTTASDAVYSPYLNFAMQPAKQPPSDFYGLPLFATRSLQEGQPFFEIPQLVRDECQAAYRQHVVEQGSQPAKIIPELQKMVDKARLQPCTPGHVLDVIREDLARAKAMIAEKMSDPMAGSQLCLPFTLGSSAMVDMAKLTGTTAIYWGVSDTRKKNLPGDDPFHLVRLKNDFIWRLPGPQRRSLPSIYLEKAMRRMRGRNPY